MELEDKSDGLVSVGGGFFGIQFCEILAIYPNFSRSGGVEGSDDVEQCTFPRTGWTYDGGTGTGLKLKVYIFENGKRLAAFGAGIGFADVVEFDHGEEKSVILIKAELELGVPGV